MRTLHRYSRIPFALLFPRFNILAGIAAMTTALLLGAVALPAVSDAAPEPLQNLATGRINGNSLTSTGAIVRLLRVGDAVTSAVSEVDPNQVFVGMLGTPFSFDILPEIGPFDQGVARVLLTAPPGLSGLALSGVTVGGTPLSAGSGTPGPGEFVWSGAGTNLTVVLGDTVTADSTRIQLQFTADVSGPEAAGDFLCVLPGASASDTTSAGDADGDPADNNTNRVQIVLGVDPGLSSVTVDPPIVLADGTAVSTITATLRNGNGQPVPGHAVAFSSDRGVLDFIQQPLALTDAGGVATGTIASLSPGTAQVTAVDSTTAVTLSDRPEVIFTQGRVLEIAKVASRAQAVIGDIVPYRIAVRNLGIRDVDLVTIDDRIPPGFKYLEGSAHANGVPLPDPTGIHTLSFALGTIPGHVDGNGNGRADPGEPGYVELVYDLVVGAGARPGPYTNVAVARDVCPTCILSNSADETVDVVPDPIFDLATIVGKVFHDHNGDGGQDSGETGVGGAMVALDDGTYAITDEHGRFHFLAVTPGHRLVKINLLSLPPGAVSTGDQSQVLWITPGLLGRVRFGVRIPDEGEAIGSPGAAGIEVASDPRPQPIEVRGSTESLDLLVNGEPIAVPSGDLQLRSGQLRDMVELDGNGLREPILFRMTADQPDSIEGWTLEIWNPSEESVYRREGSGAPPPRMTWNGRSDAGKLVLAGGIYQYQVEIRYAGGAVITSPRRIFGVNTRSAIALDLRGSAFESGQAVLSRQARQAMRQAAELMRQYPEEVVVIEGHTDDVGSDDANLDLSRRRSLAAATYFTEVESIPKERVLTRWFGEDRPVASNRTTEGRAMNRRVEIRGNVHEVERAQMVHPPRLSPSVRIDAVSVPVAEDGRFRTEVSDLGDRFPIAVTDRQGRSIRTTVPVPRLALEAPVGSVLVPYGTRDDRYEVEPHRGAGLPEGPGVVARVSVRGITDPGNEVLVDDRPLAVGADGTFAQEMPLAVGANTFGFLARNPEGVTRIVNLVVKVRDQRKDGGLVLVTESVPEMAVHLPPDGTRIENPLQWIRGITRPGNRVTANGEPIVVRADGTFTGVVELPVGGADIVVAVEDDLGGRGEIRRKVEVASNQIFLLAFADGVIGKLEGSGYLDGAGMSESRESFTEGRFAYYLKGRVAGKVLITSAFDTGRKKFESLFSDLDEQETERLFRNLDPDTFYPVYGDDSQLVYDVESRGKFYLAVDSEELSLLVGNFPVDLTDTELAHYHRALYGGRVVYRSAGRTGAGTEISAFGADGDLVHVRSELAATGGSVYYLRHGDIVEGSERVSLVVRDKNTGLTLARTPQIANRDYRIKYPEGRLWFETPVASVSESGTLIDEDLLSGHPVFIQVEYETRNPGEDARAVGARVRQHVGDHVKVGGTYVKDERGATEYELWGVDGEVGLGRGTRILGEYVESSGQDSLGFISEDGGLSWTDTGSAGRSEGAAWKVAAELDPGAWLGTPGRVNLGGYVRRTEPGFFSSGNLREVSGDRQGASLRLDTGPLGEIQANYTREDRDVAPVGAADVTTLGSVRWNKQAGRWGLTAEVQERRAEDGAGAEIDLTRYLAAAFRAQIHKRITTTIEHQSTLEGPANDQTTLGATVRLGRGFHLDARGTTGDRGESAQGGVSLDVDGTRLYATERMSNEGASARTSTVLGARKDLGRGTTVYTEYQWDRSSSSDRNVSLMGARKEWAPLSGLRLQVTGEHSRTDTGLGEVERTAFGGGVAYDHPSGVSAQTRGEVRFETGDRDRMQYFSSNQLQIGLSPDLSLLGKLRISRTRDRQSEVTEARFEERSLGLAYRPVTHDRLNALARYTRLQDEEPSRPGVVAIRTITDVGSVEATLDLTRRLELVEKVALKFKLDRSGGVDRARTRTMLSLHRVNLNLWRKLDVGVEYRILEQREADDRRTGWLNEVTWSVVRHLRLGLGYNFTDFSDNEFSDNDYSVRGWFFRVQGKY